MGLISRARLEGGGGGGGDSTSSDSTDDEQKKKQNQDQSNDQPDQNDPFLRLLNRTSGSDGSSDDQQDSSGGSSAGRARQQAEQKQRQKERRNESDARERQRLEQQQKKDQNKGKKTNKGLASKAWSTVTGVADHGAGSTDEALARSTDNQKGGGAASGIASFTGAKEWANSDQAAKIRKQFQNQGKKSVFSGDLSGGAVVNDLERANVAAKAGFDVALDNPNASLQDSVRGGIEGGVEAATGKNLQKGDMADAAQQAATEFRKETSQVTEGTKAEPVTDAAAWLGDAVVADPAKAVVKGTTGISIDKGTAEGTVSGVEAADVGLSLVGGSAAKSGAKGLIAKTLGSGEDVAGAGEDVAGATTKTGDDAASATEDATSTSDEISTDRFGRLTRGGETVGKTGAATTATGVGEDVAGAGEDLFSGLKSRLIKTGEDGTGATDDAATTTTKTGEDAASTGEDAANVGEDAAATGEDAANVGEDAAATGEDAANVGEDAASATDDSGGIKNWLKTNRGKVAGVTGAAAATGVAFTQPQNAPDTITTANGKTLTGSKTYKPTSRFPNGGKLYAVTKNGTKLGYWTLVGVKGRNMIVLDQDGSTRKAKISIEQFKKLKSGGKAGGGS